MNKKGFSIVELLVVLAIMSVLGLVAIPIYNNVRLKINENILESKKTNAVTIALEYSNETGAMAVTPRILAKEGKMELDNEIGEYLNPVNKEDLACNIIILNRDEFNNIYGDFTDEKNCVIDIDDLNLEYSNIEIIKKDNNGNILPNDWVNISPIILSYRFKSENAFLQRYVVEEKWLGEQETNGNTLTVSASSVKTNTYGLYVRTNQNGVINTHSAVAKVKMDLEPPIFTDNPRVVEENKVEIKSSDQNGSGIYGYFYGKNITNCPTAKSEYTTTTDNIFTIEMPIGTFNICLMDKAGNASTNAKSVTVNAPPSAPIIERFTVTSTDVMFNTLSTIVNIKVSGHEPLLVYLSTIGYETGGNWVNYEESYNYNVGGTLDGNERTLYLSVKDRFGNTSKMTTKYTPYKECTKTTTTNNKENVACSNQCGSGNHNVTYTTTDDYTATQCKEVVKEESCADESGCIPSCTISVDNSSLGDNNWYIKDVALTLEHNTGGYGSIVEYGLTTSIMTTYNNTKTGTQSANTPGTTWNGYVKHSNGNTADCNVTVKKDATYPECSLSLTGTPGENDWYTSNIGVWLHGYKRGLSDISSYGLTTNSSVTYNSVLEDYQTENTNGTTWYGYVKKDNGNTGKCDITVKKDSDAPSCDISLSGTEGTNGYYKSDVGIMLHTYGNTYSSIASTDVDLTTSSTPSYNGTSSATQTSDTKTTTWYGYVKKGNGLSSSCHINVKKDTVAPTCKTTKSNTGKTTGVTATFKCSSDTVTCTAKKTKLKEDKSYKIVDEAGNKGTCSVTVTKKYSSCATGSNTCVGGNVCQGGYVCKAGYKDSDPSLNAATCREEGGTRIGGVCYFNYSSCASSYYDSCASTYWSNCKTGSNTCAGGYLYS